jgi:hypothetical protein
MPVASAPGLTENPGQTGEDGEADAGFARAFREGYGRVPLVSCGR